MKKNSAQDQIVEHVMSALCTHVPLFCEATYEINLAKAVAGCQTECFDVFCTYDYSTK